MNLEGTTEGDASAIANAMYLGDRFSQLLGITIVSAAPGACVLSMKIRPDMANGFGIVHGGVTFSFGDSALAFASNSHGQLSVALEASISYTVPVQVGDTLTAVARELNRTRRIAIYDITITNQDNMVVGLFKGTVYRTSKPAPGYPG